MASSKVVVVVVSTNPDLPRGPSISSSSFLFSSHFHHLPSKNTTTMDEILKNIYPAAIEAASKQQQQSTTTTTNNNIDDVWKDFVAGGGTNHHDHQYQYQYQYHPSSDEGFSTYSPGGDQVTLEDFLVRAGAVPAPFSPHQYPSSSDASNSLAFATVKPKAVEEKLELDKATLQKQKRMIKNRESAARSRERKQAYTTELESRVNRLQTENQLLLEEQAEREKQRLKDLKEIVIPITEERRPKRKLRRLNSF